MFFVPALRPISLRVTISAPRSRWPCAKKVSASLSEKGQQVSSGKPLLLFRMLTQGFVALGWGSVGLQALTSCKRHTAGTKFHAKKAHRRQRRSRHARAHTHTHRLAQMHAARRQAKSQILLPGFWPTGPSNFFLLLQEKKKKTKYSF